MQLASLLIEQFVDRKYCFHVIGDRRLLAQLQRQADELGLCDRVRFHGHRDDIPACLRSLDLLIMCSDHEGTPMTALESLALRTAIIARSEEHTSELQSRGHLVCRLLLEKKNRTT